MHFFFERGAVFGFHQQRIEQAFDGIDRVSQQRRILAGPFSTRRWEVISRALKPRLGVFFFRRSDHRCGEHNSLPAISFAFLWIVPRAPQRVGNFAELPKT